MPLSTLSSYELIIFDNDGTLVDTEAFNCRAFADCLIEAGLDNFNEQLVIEKYAGTKVSHIIEMIEEEYHVTLPGDITEQFLKRAEELRPSCQKDVPGAADFIQACLQRGQKICIGSNGQMEAILSSLKHGKLDSFFPVDIIFNAVMVNHPKPAPDLFLYVAQKMGVRPEKCLVLEDSPLGIRAARKAGMDCVGLTGTHHTPVLHRQTLLDAGADATYKSFIHMPQA